MGRVIKGIAPFTRIVIIHPKKLSEK